MRYLIWRKCVAAYPRFCVHFPVSWAIFEGVQSHYSAQIKRHMTTCNNAQSGECSGVPTDIAALCVVVEMHQCDRLLGLLSVARSVIKCVYINGYCSWCTSNEEEMCGRLMNQRSIMLDEEKFYLSVLLAGMFPTVITNRKMRSVCWLRYRWCWLILITNEWCPLRNYG